MRDRVLRTASLCLFIHMMTTPVAVSATKTWISNLGGNWSDPAKWSGGTIPAAGDDVVISGAGASTTGAFTVTLNVSAPALNSLTLGDTSPDGLQTLQILVGVTLPLNGPSTIHPDGRFVMSSGTLSGTGSLNITPDAEMTLSDVGSKNITILAINNAGTIQWSGGQINTGGGLVVNNQAGGLFDVSAVAGFLSNLGGGTATLLNNGGTLKKSGGAGVSNIGVRLNNSGGVAVDTATLRLSAGGTHTGSFTGASGTTLEFGGGTHDVNPGSAISGFSTVHFDAGTVNINGSVDFNGGTAQFSGGNGNILGLVANLGTLSVNGGIANVNNGAATVSVGALTLASGTLRGATPLNVTGLTTWTGGVLEGSGKLTVSGGMNISGATGKQWRTRTIDNPALTTWTGALISSGAGATFNNLTGGTFDIKTDQSIHSNLGLPASKFVNDGSIVKSAGTLTSTFDIFVDNNKAVQVQTGTLAFAEGSTHDAATITGVAGTTLQFAALTSDINSGSSISGFSTVHFDAGTVNIPGSIDVTGGRTLVSGASVNFTGTIVSLGNVVDITGGTANINNGGSVTIGTLNFTSGTLTGSTALSVTGLTTWSGGVLEGTGKLTVAGGMNISGAGGKNWRTRVIDNPATTTWTGATLNTGVGATFNNLTGSKFDIKTDQFLIFNLGGAASRFVNDGTILKSAGTGTATLDLFVDNNKSVQVQSGMLTFGEGSTHDGATLTGAAGTTLGFAGLTHDINAGSSISGFSTVHFDFGAVNVAGSIDVAATGTTLVSGATVNLTGTAASLGALISVTGGTLNVTVPVTTFATTVSISGGTANFDNAATYTIDALTISSGTLTGATALNVTGPTKWTGGTIEGAGKLTVSGGMEISGLGGKNWRTRTIDNPATTTWSGSTINSGSGATLNNRAGATFDIKTDQFLIFNLGGAASKIVNDGRIIKSAGTGITTIDVFLDNNRSVEVQTGNLTLGEGSTHDGATVTGLAGTTLRFAGLTHDVNLGSSISGFPTVHFDFGTVNIPGSIDVTGGTTLITGASVNLTGAIPSLGSTVEISSGTANINNGSSLTIGTLTFSSGTLTGSTALNVTGMTTWNGGTIEGTGKLTVSGGMNIATSGGKNWRTRVIDNPALTTWSGATVNTGLGATFNNLAGATFDIRTDQFLIFNLGGTASRFVNDGRILKSAGAGISTLDLFVDNNKTVEVQTGNLTFAEGSTHDGATLSGAAGTTLRFAGLTHDVNPGSSISGFSTVHFDFGTVDIGGSIDVTGGTTQFTGATANFTGAVPSLGDLVSLTSGTANINNGGSLSIETLTITGGTLTGSTGIDVTGLTTWAGGTIEGTGKLTVSGGMNITGFAGKNWRTRVIENPATTTWTGTAINSGLGARFDNLAGGTFDIQNDQFLSFNLGGSQSVFNNEGLFKKSGGGGTSTISVRFNNTGTVEAPLGTLSFTGGFVQTAGVTRLNGGTISTSVATVLDIQGGILTGSGTILNNVRNGGALNTGQSPGKLSITGTYTQTATGVLNIEVAGLVAGSEHDQLAVGGATSLAGTLNATTIAPYDPNDTDVFTVMTYPSVSGDFTTKNLSFGPGRTFIATRNPANYILTASIVEADLRLTKTAPASVLAATPINYNLNVTNLGPDASEGITVTDQLDPNVVFVHANTTGFWSCARVGQVVTCTSSASLSAGSSAEPIVITVTAPAQGIVSNSASVTASIYDPNSANNSAGPVVTTIEPVSNLTISKTDSADPVDANAELQYTISVTNSGPSAAVPTTVTDTLPAGVTFISAAGSGWACSFADPIVTCTAASIGVGTAAPITIKVTTPAAGGTITNTATVTSPADDSPSSDSETTTVLAADLSITKTGPSNISAATNITYVITVQNVGPSSASNVSVSDALDPNVTFVSANSSGFWNCSYSSPAVTCAATATLAVGTAPENITIVVTAPGEPMTVSNSASVTSSTPDPAAANNHSGSISTTVSPEANVSIVKVAPAAPIAANQPLTFTLHVQNAGPSTATNLVVTDVIDPRFTFVSADAGDWTCQFDAATATVTCDRPSLVVGAAPPIEIVVQTPFEAAVVPNTATVTATGDPDPSDNTSSINTTVNAAIDLSVTKSDAPDPAILGTTLTYTIVVTNAGPSTATNVAMNDVLPSGLTFLSATPTQGSCNHSSGTVSCSLGSIARSASATITIAVRPDALGVIANTATVSAAETDTNAANDSDTEATTVGELRADLSITKLDTPDPVDAGANLTYTIEVTNAGPDAAASVTVTDILPPGATLVTAGGTGWSCNSASPVVCSLTTLAVGPAEPLTIVVTIAAAGTVTNTASVSSTTTDPDPDDNSAQQTTTVLAADADVFVIKTANPDRVSAGAELTYELTIGNHGPALATSVVVTDTLPNDVDLVSVEPSTGTCMGTATITCDLGSIARDGIATVTIRVRTGNAGVLANTATATADEDDSDLTNNSSSVTTVVDPPGDVSVSKIGPSTVSAGGEASYVIQVINGTSAPVDGVAVRDNFPAHLAHKRWTCSATPGSECGRPSGSGNINIKVDLAPFGVVTFSAVTSVVPGACGSITNTATIEVPEGVSDPNLDNNSSSTTAQVLCGSN